MFSYAPELVATFRAVVPSAFIRTMTEEGGRAETTQIVSEISGEVMAKFTIRKVNQALGFSCKLELHPSLRGLGLYRPLHRYKLERARLLGYGTLLATVDVNNEAEMRAALRNGRAVSHQIPGKHVPWVNMLVLSTGLAPQPQED